MEEHSYSGNFIVVEGPDGAGTTTQSKKLAEELGAYWTAEPGKRRPESDGVAEKLEEMISKEGYSPEAVGLGFALDRKIHLEEEVIPRLKNGETVVSDRYVYSSMVYQPAMGADQDWVNEINTYALIPDMAVFLDVAAVTGMDRVDSRGEDGNIFEKMSFQEEVVSRYRKLAEQRDEVIKIDGSESIEEVSKQLNRRVKSRLK